MHSVDTPLPLLVARSAHAFMRRIKKLSADQNG